MRMKPFTMVAIPHEDILEGRLTEDVFAADLWEVFKNRGSEDYRDPDIFFKDVSHERDEKSAGNC